MNTTFSSELVTALQACEAFQDLSQEQIEALAGELSLLVLPTGQTLYQQDSPGDSMAVLISGRLQAKLIHGDGSETVIDDLAPGATVGVSSLLIGHKRSATVNAVQESHLLLLSKAGFDHLLQLRPDIRLRFEQNLRLHLLNSYLVRAIHTLLPDLNLDTLHSLQERLEWLDVPSGEMLFAENDPSDGLYFVIYGRLCYAYQASLDQPLGEITAGECVGEIGLVTGEPRSTSVYALRDTLVARLDRLAFDELIQRHPHLIVQLARRVIERNRPPGAASARQSKHRSSLRRLATGTHPETSAGERAPTQVFVVAPLSPDIPVEAFTRQLAAALARMGTTGQITREDLGQAFGRSADAQDGLTESDILCIQAWLSEQEQFYEYVLYAADPVREPAAALTPWTRRCLRQADLVLLVGNAGQDPAISPLERGLQLAAPRARCDLVLIQPDHARRPSGTARWLEPRGVQSHHHMRLSRSDDFEHLARYLTGQGVGLVLAGGAARGYAHIGVIQSLQEHNFPIDFIGGTSMGSILAAGYASGMAIADMIDLARQFSSPLKLFDPTLPAVSFFSSDKVTRVLQKIFGDTCIEDLWRPYFCVSSNLTHAEAMVHQRGPLWQAVRASSAIPGVFTPVVYNGDLLVDGVVLNNLPVDVMWSQMRGGMIVAVNVIPEVDLDQQYAFGPSVSGWGQLAGRLNPLSEGPQHAPWIFETLLRVVALNDVHAARAKRWMADIYITPPVERYNMLDFGAYLPIIEIGYQAANQAIQEWKAQHASGGGRRPVETLQQALDKLDAYLGER